MVWFFLFILLIVATPADRSELRLGTSVTSRKEGSGKLPTVVRKLTRAPRMWRRPDVKDQSERRAKARARREGKRSCKED